MFLYRAFTFFIALFVIQLCWTDDIFFYYNRWDRADIAQTLLLNGCPADEPNDSHQTPLLIACKEGKVSCAAAILEAGASINQSEHRTEDTLLHLAARLGNADLMSLLLSYEVEANEYNSEGMAPLHLLASLGHLDALNLLLQHPDIDKQRYV